MNGVVLHEPLLRQLNPAAAEFDDGYRMLVELVPEAIWLNCGGQVVYANPAAQRLFGALDAALLVGSDALARVPLESRHQLAQFSSDHSPCAEQPPRCPLQLRRVDGTLVDVEYFGCAVRFNDCESVMNVAHDLTGRREHEQAIEHQATHDLLAHCVEDAHELLAGNEVGVVIAGTKPWSDSTLTGVFASGFAHYESL